MSTRALLLILGALTAARLSGQAPGIVDPAFRPALNGLPPDTVLPLPDGRLYLAGSKLGGTVEGRPLRNITRLNRDGSIDPAFHLAAGLEITTLVDNPLNRPPLGTLLRADARVTLVAQPDGKLVLFTRASVPGVRSFPSNAFPLARINHDGSPDPSFKPAPTFLASATTPLCLADGRWLIVTPGIDAEFRRTLTLARFTPDGATDPTYADTILRPPGAPTAFGGPGGDPYREVLVHTVDHAGRIYVAAFHSYTIYNRGFTAPSFTPGGRNPRTTIFRLNPDGTPDATFAPQTVDEVMALRATDQGLLCQLNTWTAGPGISFGSLGDVRGMIGGTTTVIRIKPSGEIDAAFRPPSWTTFGAHLNQIAAAPDGSILALFFGQKGHRGVVRFDPTGAYDPDFHAELGETTALVTELFPLPDGDMLAFGSFSAVGGIDRPYLARLRPGTRATTTYLANLAVRARAGTGPETLTAGYITAGGDASVLARAAGPALAPFGIANPLADPQLTLFVGARSAATNDDWNAEPGVLLAATAARLGAFPFAAGSRDAALLTTLPAGPGTVQVAGGESTAGVALLELYHAGPGPVHPRSPRFANLAARASAGSGAGTLIVGFTLRGDAPRTVLLRAAGPALAKFGVAGVLGDPVLTLFRDGAVLARNDQWQEGTAEEEFLRREAFAATGAFPFDPGSRDAALVVSLAPGHYTAHATAAAGAGAGTEGIALLELYEVP